ncbi:MAG: chromosomal replication initiator protein DnaA [Ktedonobacteraceae bacterium]|nr:chromosomal replication initiator protein DnaA [Ktedonobacteraceae bacterium]
MNTATIWRTVLERLETTAIDTTTLAWLQDAHLESVPQSEAAVDLSSEEENPQISFLLQVPDARARDTISLHLQDTLEQLLTKIVGQAVTLSVSDDSGISPEGIPQATSQPSPAPLQQQPLTSTAYQSLYSYPDTTPAPAYYAYKADSTPLEEWEHEQRANILMHNRLNPRYTFDAFIVGGSNRLAHAASLAVAEAPGESYNPLFLYGGVGLGKTHLLHAIGHLGVQRGLAVLYVSSEQFTNEIVNAIRYRTTEEFRAKYRSVDILLVDDIQFIAGKESTEEEFFHTFNSLYEMSKQIVICSDRPPKAIVSLEERLRSRFEWGLIADIQPPDLETRMAILRAKAELLGYRVPDEIIAYIAGRVQTNIRELEGCLNRLMAYQQLHRVELTMDVARAALSSMGNDTRETRLDSRQIASAVADYYHIPLEAMCGKQRDKHIVMPRQVAMYLIRQETQASLLEIGLLFGGRDHSTVLHACEKIDRAINVNPTLRREIIAIREQLIRDA